MSKHQSGYSEKNAINFLQMLKGIILGKRKACTNKEIADEPPEKHLKRTSRRIMIELDFVGISPKAVGYTYLADAIQIVMNEPTPNICNIIAEKYKKTESSVERAIQNAINRAWRRSDIDMLLQHYTARINPNKGVPTMTEFIYYYANKIKNEY